MSPRSNWSSKPPTPSPTISDVDRRSLIKAVEAVRGSRLDDEGKIRLIDGVQLALNQYWGVRHRRSGPSDGQVLTALNRVRIQGSALIRSIEALDDASAGHLLRSIQEANETVSAGSTIQQTILSRLQLDRVVESTDRALKELAELRAAAKLGVDVARLTAFEALIILIAPAFWQATGVQPRTYSARDSDGYSGNFVRFATIAGAIVDEAGRDAFGKSTQNALTKLWRFLAGPEPR